MPLTLKVRLSPRTATVPAQLENPPPCPRPADPPPGPSPAPIPAAVPATPPPPAPAAREWANKGEFIRECNRRRDAGLVLTGNTYPVRDAIKAAGGPVGRAPRGLVAARP